MVSAQALWHHQSQVCVFERRSGAKYSTVMAQESQAECVWISAPFPLLHSIPYFGGLTEACPKLPALMHLCSFSTEGVKHYRLYFTLEVQFFSLLAPPQL